MKKRILAICMTACLMLSMAVSAFATGAGSETVDTSGIVGALGAFNTTNLLSVITAGLGIAVPLVLLWFAFRWIYKKAKGALKKGS